MWYFLVAGFCAGVVGATLAIGGALILIPVWLKVGIDKDVAASSTAALILTSAMVAFTIAYFNSFYSQISTLTLLFYLILAFASAAIVKGTQVPNPRLRNLPLKQVQTKIPSNRPASHRRRDLTGHPRALPADQDDL